MHIVALLLKSKGTNDVFSISLEWLNSAVFGKLGNICRALANLENAFSSVLLVQQSFSGSNINYLNEILLETSAFLQFAVEYLESNDMKSDALGCL